MAHSKLAGLIACSFASTTDQRRQKGSLISTWCGFAFAIRLLRSPTVLIIKDATKSLSLGLYSLAALVILGGLLVMAFAPRRLK